MNNKFAIYLRVSTQKQGGQGLGISAQRDMCRNFVNQQNGTIEKEFMDVESGSHRNRKGLWASIEYCKTNGCELVIAKLDRLARDVEFVFKVVNTGIDIHFCDMPVINTMILGVFASVAQYERELICSRTKAALDAKRARGESMGGTNELWGKNTGADREEALINAREASARARRERMKSEPSNQFLINYMKSQIKNGRVFISKEHFESLADELNMLGMKTPSGLAYDKKRAQSQYIKLCNAGLFA